MSPILFAFGAAGLKAFNSIVFRHSLRDHDDVWSTALAFYGLTTIVLLCFFPLPDVSSLSWTSLLLLLLGGSCWALITYCDFKAYQYLEASACEVIGTITIVLLCLSGCLVFTESFSLSQALGIAVIISTIIYTAGVKAIPMNRGVLYKLGSVLFVTVVYSIDKYLVSEVPKEAMLYFGYCTPALLLFLIHWRSVRHIGTALQRSNFALLVVPISSVIRFQLVLLALSGGGLGITYTVLKTSILFVFVFEILLLRMREGLARKALACLGCLCGAAILGT